MPIVNSFSHGVCVDCWLSYKMGVSESVIEKQMQKQKIYVDNLIYVYFWGTRFRDNFKERTNMCKMQKKFVFRSLTSIVTDSICYDASQFVQ